jgi:uncharacterized alkaline shock family protein YloU
VAVADPQSVLACGRSLETLIERVIEDHPTADADHQASCPYCQIALRALAEAWGEVEAFARQPVPVPVGLTERIMSRVRALVARMPDAVILIGARGQTRVSERVIGRVARAAALTVPGVVLPSARRVGVDSRDPRRVRLDMRLVIAFGPSIDALAQAVRARVSACVNAQTGARVDAIDLVVDDVVRDT